MRPFVEHLNQLEAQQKRPKSSRIADLFPEIEAALAKGFSRSQIVEALKAEGIEVTPALLSTYLQRLRKQVGSGQSPSRSESPAVAPDPSLPGAPAPVYGEHDPRRLDEIMRSTPDMKALAKLGRKGKP